MAIITPFNFPLEIPALQLMGALFMGNKPLLHVDRRCPDRPHPCCVWRAMLRSSHSVRCSVPSRAASADQMFWALTLHADATLLSTTCAASFRHAYGVETGACDPTRTAVRRRNLCISAALRTTTGGPASCLPASFGSTHVRRVSIVAEQLLRLLHHCGAPTTDVDLVHGLSHYHCPDLDLASSRTQV